MIVTVRPSAAGTSARFVHSKVEPPSRLIYDGTTTLVFGPALTADGLAEAAEFAEILVQVASEWEAGCRRMLAAAQDQDPFTVATLVAEYGPAGHGDGE
jgi:hypothetical protein